MRGDHPRPKGKVRFGSSTVDQQLQFHVGSTAGQLPDLLQRRIFRGVPLAAYG